MGLFGISAPSPKRLGLRPLALAHSRHILPKTSPRPRRVGYSFVFSRPISDVNGRNYSVEREGTGGRQPDITNVTIHRLHRNLRGSPFPP
jgi:hypothetical protein